MSKVCAILLLALLPTGLGVAAELAISWPLPEIPPEANLAATAAPRADWLEEVDAHIRRARSGPVNLLFLGDSITHAWGAHTGRDAWQKNYGALNAAAFGIGGDRTEHLLWRLQHGEIDGLSPKLIVLLIGSNNTRRDPAPQIAEGVGAVVRELRRRAPCSPVLLLGIFPRGETPGDPLRAKIQEANRHIASLADEAVTFLDLGPRFLGPDGTISREVMHDFLHLTPRGFEIWAEAIAPFVQDKVGCRASAPAVVR